MNTISAAGDSTAIITNADIYTAPTTIFGIYDPLNVQMKDHRIVFNGYGDLYTASNCFSASFIQNFLAADLLPNK